MSKPMSLVSRVGEADSCSCHPSWSCWDHGGPVLRQGPPPLHTDPWQQTWSLLSSKVHGSSWKSLVGACLLWEWRPHLALVLCGRSGVWRRLEEVLGQL